MSTPVCRVCLVVNVKMFYNQSFQIREFYETVTGVQLDVTGRPQGVCFICHSLLHRCCRFSEIARKSEQTLSDMFNKGIEVNQQTIGTFQCQVKDNKVIDLSVAKVKHTAAGDHDTMEYCTVIGIKEEEDPLQVKVEITPYYEHTTEECTTLDDKGALENVLSQQSLIKGNVDAKQACANSQTKDIDETFEMKVEKQNPVMDPNVLHNKGETDNTKNAHTCDQCNKSFSHKSSLANHKRTHTKAKSYSCDHCETTFAERSNFVKHMLTHSKEKLHTCNRCDKSFTQIHRLVVHKRSHTGEKPYKCMQCNKCFSENSNLVKHMRTHTGDKPFSCGHCKKTFTHKDGLVKHERIHTGERPFTCRQCPRSFTEKSNLVKHIQTHTERKPFTCDSCFKCFAYKNSLVHHKQTHTESKP